MPRTCLLCVLCALCGEFLLRLRAYLFRNKALTLHSWDAKFALENVQDVSTEAFNKGVGDMGTADVDYTFHKHLPVVIQRKKFLGKTSPHRAYIQDINIHGGRLFTTEPLTENCLICITFRDPDSDANRTLCARVTHADCIVYQGKKVFQAYMEFLKLTKHDEVMLQNIFYASPT